MVGDTKSLAKAFFQLQAKLTSRTIQPLSIQGIFTEMGNVSVSFGFEDPISRPASHTDAAVGGVKDADVEVSNCVVNIADTT